MLSAFFSRASMNAFCIISMLHSPGTIPSLCMMSLTTGARVPPKYF